MTDIDLPASAHWAYDDAGLEDLRDDAHRLLALRGAVGATPDLWDVDARWRHDAAGWQAGITAGWGDLLATPGRLPELGALAEAAGRAASGIPLIGTALAASVLAACGDGDVARLREGACAALVWGGPQDPPELTAAPERGAASRVRLSGHVPFVLDAPSAELFVAAATAPGGDTVLCVLDETPPVTTRALMDPSRGVGAVSFDGAGARVLARGAPAAAMLVDAGHRGAALLALDAIGAAACALELTVEYAGRRRQFGQLIGGFQAVSHRCADMLVTLETARSLARHAPWPLAAGQPAQTAVSAAKSAATEGAVEIGRAAIQLHGGIGMTWDRPVHVLYKRAWLDRALLGEPSFHREQLVRELEAAEPVPGRPTYRTPF